jgi:hypothetical protein
MLLSVTAIIPDGDPVNAEAELAALLGAMDRGAGMVKADFDTTIDTWNEKPEFKIEAPDRWHRLIFVESQIYSWINDGTPAHEILPVRAQALAFMTGGQSKTQPNSLGSGPGVPGTNFVMAHKVMNPGITARNFDELIATFYAERFPQMIQEALNES